MHKSFAALWSAVALCLASPCQAQETGIQYGPDPAQLLDVCRPAAMTRQAPAMLMIHGGGWYQGSRSSQAAACQLVAQTGVVAIPVDYRLLSSDLAKKWPLQFNDVQLAMRWVRAHAVELGVNPNHICAEGDSAGGQLALMLDVVPRIGPGDAQNALSGVSPRADCVVSISGPTDLLAIETAHPGYGNVLVGPGNPAFRNARKRDASPALRVAAGDGPALLIHGLDDPQVPFAQAVEMQAAFAQSGTQAWLISHPGGHEFKGMSGEQSHAIWRLIGAFVQSRHLAGPPREMSMDDILP